MFEIESERNAAKVGAGLERTTFIPKFSVYHFVIATGSGTLNAICSNLTLVEVCIDLLSFSILSIFRVVVDALHPIRSPALIDTINEYIIPFECTILDPFC